MCLQQLNIVNIDNIYFVLGADSLYLSLTYTSASSSVQLKASWTCTLEGTLGIDTLASAPTDVGEDLTLIYICDRQHTQITGTTIRRKQ